MRQVRSYPSRTRPDFKGLCPAAFLAHDIAFQLGKAPDFVCPGRPAFRPNALLTEPMTGVAIQAGVGELRQRHHRRASAPNAAPYPGIELA